LPIVFSFNLNYSFMTAVRDRQTVALSA